MDLKSASQLPLTLLDSDLIAARTISNYQQQQQLSSVSSAITTKSSAQKSFPRLRVVNSTITEADAQIRVYADENEMRGSAAALRMSQRRLCQLQRHHRRPLSAARKPLTDITDAFPPASSSSSLSSTHIVDNVSSVGNSASSRKRQISDETEAVESCPFIKPAVKRSRSSVSSLR